MSLRVPCAFCSFPRAHNQAKVRFHLGQTSQTIRPTNNVLAANFSPEDSVLGKDDCIHCIDTCETASDLASITVYTYPALSLETKATEFEPILNVPALGSFLLIFAVFSFLVQRTWAIEQATDSRTKAIERVRKLKSLELNGDATQEDVDRAITSYRKAYEKVEKLRYVIPGIARITPPPAGSLSRKFMQENEVAARQFLGIETDETSTVADPDESKETGLSPALVAVLAFVAASQIVLLGFLSSDPMSTKDLLDVAAIGLE